MKTIFRHIAFFALFITGDAFAQDVTTVRANSDISDNLDLKAVASIFGESNDLEDFERRLNDPDMQISNLDLNGDNRVDYLRVIEATESNTHLIIIQSVLSADVFQDVATIEVERDRNNNVQVQVVGDVYMYGPNYIYQPVYAYNPFIFDIFWVSSYRPYYSPWYWGYYPTYYSYWAPCPVYRYRNHIHTYVNPRNTYAYTNTRNSSRAASMYNSRRQNGYERQHPNTSFSSRNKNVSNRYALEQNRSKSGRGAESTRSTFANSSRLNTVNSSNINTVRRNGNAVRTTDNSSGRGKQTVRTADVPPARNSNNAARNNSARREMSQPERIERSSQISNRSVERSASAPSRNAERSAEAVQQRSAPSNNNMSAPARSSARSTPSEAPARQSAPAPSQSRGGGGNSRRG